MSSFVYLAAQSWYSQRRGALSPVKADQPLTTIADIYARAQLITPMTMTFAPFKAFYDAATQAPPIKSGDRTIFLTLDDGTGLADITLFPRSHADCARTVFTSWLLVVEGRVNRRSAAPTIIGQRAWLLTAQATPSQLWHASDGRTG